MKGKNMKKDTLQRQPKKLCYIDKTTGDYIEADCKLKSTSYEVREFLSSIERMKLDSSIMGGTLKVGKSSSQLIKEYKKLFQSNVLDFSHILNLYKAESRDSNAAIIPILSFLSLFDIKVSQTCSSLEVYTSLTKSRNPLFSTDPYEINKKKLKSITANTEVMEHPIMKIRSIDTSKVGGITSEKILIKSNKNKVNVAMG